MTQPIPPWPPLVTVDIARQSTLVQAMEDLQAALAQLLEKVDIIMTDDATVAAAAVALEADAAALTTTVTALQGLVMALQTEVAAGGLTPATKTALARAEADLATVTGKAQADVTADTPPSGA